MPSVDVGASLKSNPFSGGQEHVMGIDVVSSWRHPPHTPLDGVLNWEQQHKVDNEESISLPAVPS